MLVAIAGSRRANAFWRLGDAASAPWSD